MAPEVILLQGATTSSDIWSLGCSVIELVTGQPPYIDLAPMSALFAVVQDDHPELPEGISSDLVDFLMTCFHKEPSDRPTARELLKHTFLVKYVGDISDQLQAAMILGVIEAQEPDDEPIETKESEETVEDKTAELEESRSTPRVVRKRSGAS